MTQPKMTINGQVNPVLSPSTTSTPISTKITLSPPFWPCNSNKYQTTYSVLLSLQPHSKTYQLHHFITTSLSAAVSVPPGLLFAEINPSSFLGPRYCLCDWIRVTSYPILHQEVIPFNSSLSLSSCTIIHNHTTKTT